MKKLSVFFFATLLLTLVLVLSAAAADKVVYLNGSLTAAGDGTTPETALTTFVSAVKAVPSGGTIVVCGDTPIPVAGVEVAKTTGTVTVTSAYGGADYDADLILNGRLVLSGAYTFENMNIHNNSTTQGIEIFARGYTLTMEETVTCTSAGGGLFYPVIYGGKRMGIQTADTHLVIKGGTWRSIFGGNYSKAVLQTVLPKRLP